MNFFGFHRTRSSLALSPLASVRIETWHVLVGFQPVSSLLKSNSYESFGSIYLAYLQRYPKRAHTQLHNTQASHHAFVWSRVRCVCPACRGVIVGQKHGNDGSTRLIQAVFACGVLGGSCMLLFGNHLDKLRTFLVSAVKCLVSTRMTMKKMIL